jgi:hypothetical protein
MKYLFKDMEVKEVSKQHIYKTSFENGGVFIEKIETSSVPDDYNKYYIPAEVTNHLGERKMGLVFCQPEFRTIHPPILVPNNEGKLVDIFQTEFIDLYKGYSYLPLILTDPFDGEDLNSTNDIKWSEFVPQEIPNDVAYFFVMYDFEIKSENTKLDRYTIIQRTRIEDSDHNGAIVPRFALRKIKISRFPHSGRFWYLPVEITFNTKQKKRGYALYDAAEKYIFDLHVFDPKFGLVSAAIEGELLEDCGIFKDDNAFSYKLLLTGVDAKANDNIKS